jgi:hypothetical protein
VNVLRYSLRVAKEGWRLLTLETEVNGNSKNTNERGPFLDWFVEILFCLGCCSRPEQNIFFLTVHYFNSFVPIGQQAGQAALLGRLSLSMCL